MTDSSIHGGIRRRASGFSVLEVLVALTVFSLVSVAIFAVFRAAIRSNERTERETEVIRDARFALEVIERDLMNLYFRDETSYNVNITRQIEGMEQARIEAEEENKWDEFYERYGGDPRNPKEEGSIGNPYQRGRLVDVQMEGTNEGEKDKLTFATHYPHALGRPYRPYGLARIHYFVNEKGWLIRSEEDVEAVPRDQFGQITEYPDPPTYFTLAEGVQEFNISYSFWYDNQWYEIEEWSSSQRLLRNSNYLIGEYDRDKRDAAFGRGRQQDPGDLQPGSPGWNAYINDQDNQPLDRLPGTIRISLALKDPDAKGRATEFERIFRILPAEEAYKPTEYLNEDERENERFLRDQMYRMIFPGAMTKF